MYTKLPVSVYSGNVNENLTTLYDMVTEMAQELRTVSKSLEETKGKLNETEKELKDVTEELADVTEELRETKRQLNATEKKVNTGGTHKLFIGRLCFQSCLSVHSGVPM